jgi:Domain of unknown function (DUF6378)
MSNLQQTLDERGAAYGSFEDMAFTAQTLKVMLVHDGMSSVQKEATDLICTKLARIAHGDPNHRDSWLDIEGYAHLVVLDLDAGGQ